MPGRLDALVKSMIFPRPTPATFSAATHADTLLHLPCVDPDTLLETGRFTNAYLFRQPASTHLIIYAHPNAVDIGIMHDEMRHLSRQVPADVLSFEYSGYGLTKCEITEASVSADMVSAYQFVRHYLGTPAPRIILCGRSIGAAPAAQLAASLPATETPSLLVMQCPFTALSECITEFSQNAVTIANFLGYNLFRTIDLIADVRCPVVLHHGTHDTTVPILHSYTLRQRRDAAARPCVTYFHQEDGKGHNNLSLSLLIQIIQGSVVAEGLAPLGTPWPSCLVARSPLYPHLFPSGNRKEPLRLVQRQWRQTFNLGRFLHSRKSLYALLTASVCSYAVKVSHAWQTYSAVVRRNARNTSAATSPTAASSLSNSSTHSSARRHRSGGGGGIGSGGGGGGSAGDRRCSKEEFIARCLACWGSPLGVYAPVAGLSRTADALVFGAYVPPGKWDTFDIGWHFSTRPAGPMLTVAELPATPGLLWAIQKILSSAPELLSNRGYLLSPMPTTSAAGRHASPTSSSTGGSSYNASFATPDHNNGGGGDGSDDDDDGDEDDRERTAGGATPNGSTNTLPAFVSADLVASVQTECERIVGFMDEASTVCLRDLFADFTGGLEARLSPKSRAIPGSSFQQETFEELHEWLRPYLDQPRAMAAVAEEVPWDYYLFKARVLAARLRLHVEMDWGDCVQLIDEAGVVASIDELFHRYYLHRVTIPDA